MPSGDPPDPPSPTWGTVGHPILPKHDATWRNSVHSIKRYAPKCLEGGFSEVRQEKDQISLVWGIPGSSCLATLRAAAPMGSGSTEACMEDVKQLTPEQIMNLGMAFGGSKTL